MPVYAAQAQTNSLILLEMLAIGLCFLLNPVQERMSVLGQVVGTEQLLRQQREANTWPAGKLARGPEGGCVAVTVLLASALLSLQVHHHAAHIRQP